MRNFDLYYYHSRRPPIHRHRKVEVDSAIEQRAEALRANKQSQHIAMLCSLALAT